MVLSVKTKIQRCILYFRYRFVKNILPLVLDNGFAHKNKFSEKFRKLFLKNIPFQYKIYHYFQSIENLIESNKSGIYKVPESLIESFNTLQTACMYSYYC